MRKTLHLTFPGKTDTRVASPISKPLRWHFDHHLADPLLHLDGGMDEGDAGRPKPL